MAKKIGKLILYIVIAGLILTFSFNNMDAISKKSEITYTEFIELAEEGEVEKIVINGDMLKIYPYNSNNYYTTKYIDNQELIDFCDEQSVIINAEAEEESIFSILLSLFISFFPFLLIFWIFSMMMSKFSSDSSQGGMGGIMSVGKNQSKLYKEDDTGITFADVAGQDEAKESLEEIIDYLHNTEKYNKIGAKLPKGALLVGPPGTGKTLLAKAVAGEAKVPFYSMNGSDFVQMFVGVGASRVRDLFEEAKKNAPCIIFIDEIDAIGKTRDGGVRGGGNDEREQTLNQLLAEMDGFDSTKAIVVLAATNRPEILDKALLRPGRFDRRVIVDKPDLKGRINILQVHIKDVCIDETVDLQAIAHATAGGSGADLANIVNEAALRAVRFNKNAVSQADLMESVEVVFAGKEKKDRVMSEKERRIVAYHEIGHAVVAALQKNSAPVQKITIVPRTMGSLGYTMQIPEEEKYLSTKEEIYEEVRTLLGGRCAEEIIFNTITTGASNDIERATSAVREMITMYGMTDEFDMVAFESVQNRYLDGTPVRNCSDTTSARIDAKIVEIVRECHLEAKEMIKNNKKLIDELAEYLLEKENITGEEFMDIFIKYYPDAKRPETKEIEKTVKNNVLPKEEPIKSKAKTSEKNNVSETEESTTEKLSKLFKQKTDEMKTNIQETFAKEPEEPQSKESVPEKEEIIINIPIEIEEPLDEPLNFEDIPMEPSFDEIDIPIIEGVSDPIEDIPMAPDFDLDKREESKDKDEQKKEPDLEKEVKKSKYDIKASNPEELNPRQLNNNNNKSKTKKKQNQKQTSTVKKDDLSSLMNSFKNNPQSLAGKKKKNGIYLDDKKNSNETKKSKLPNIENMPEDTSSKNVPDDDITEDMY